MKKISLIIFMVLGAIISANAQSSQCQIKGALDGASATVTVDYCDLDGDEITVSFHNDSNTTVTITAIVSNNKCSDVVITATVPPNSSTTKKHTWTCDYQPLNINIQSAKCQ